MTLPFIAGLVSLAVFSAATIALSAVAISKNKTVSQQEKFESRVAQRKQEEENGRAELKIPGIIELPYKDAEVSSPENQQDKDEDIFYDTSSDDERDTETPSPENQPAKDAESGDERDTEISSPENEPAKEENGQGWGAWGKAKVAATVTAGIGLCGAALCYAAPYIPTLLNGVAASSAGSKLGYTNDTMCYPYKM